MCSLRFVIGNFTMNFLEYSIFVSCTHVTLSHEPEHCTIGSINVLWYITYVFQLAIESKSIFWFSFKATTDILLPGDPMPILEHRECTVEPGCTYDVYVETADRRIQSILRYTVPGSYVHRDTTTHPPATQSQQYTKVCCAQKRGTWSSTSHIWREDKWPSTRMSGGKHFGDVPLPQAAPGHESLMHIYNLLCYCRFGSRFGQKERLRI